MQSNDIIITTTNSIENAHVEKYLGIVTSNLVVGTGFFSDLTASLTDFFGGMSGTYKEHMNELYSKAYDELKSKAIALGANCVLGFKIDFDEISGKGMQMFMVSVSGTAVVVKYDSSHQGNQDNTRGIVSNRQIDIDIFKYKWAHRNQRELPTNEELIYILRNRLTELLPSLYDCIKNCEYQEDTRCVIDKFAEMLMLCNFDDAIEVIYTDYVDRVSIAHDIICKHNFFSPKHALSLLNAGHTSLAIGLLKATKPYYTKEDLVYLEKISDTLTSLPKLGKIETVKAGFMSNKMKEVYICPKGHTNDIDQHFCTYDYGVCGLNIYGLTETEAKLIEELKYKIEILKQRLNT